jgi:hypothetical protein
LAVDGEEKKGWISSLSRGGLFSPTEEFMGLMKQFEEVFQCYHGSEISLDPDPINKFGVILKNKFPLLPNKLLFFYSKVRFFIRLRHLNKCLDLELNEMEKKYFIHLNKYK